MECKCPHGHDIRKNTCTHKYEQTEVNVLKLNPGFMGKRTYWLHWCCGKAMSRYIIIDSLRECTECGDTQNYGKTRIALCLCCKKKIDTTP